MNLKVALSIAVLMMAAYVVFVAGGKVKFGKLFEIESKGNHKAEIVETPKPPNNVNQDAVSNGAGAAVNANNGASVRIGQ